MFFVIKLKVVRIMETKKLGAFCPEFFIYFFLKFAAHFFRKP